jgi:6-phosphogluconolactonase
MNQQILYIGCYTPEGNAGIKVVEFNNQCGQLNEINSISDLPDTSFLAISKNKNYLFAVSENETEGALGCFDIKQPTSPIFVNKQSTLGGSPCHISLTTDKVFVSNYSSGNVSAFLMTEHQLVPAYTDVQHKGQGSNLERQASAHAHASQISVDGNFLVVADLGIDALKVYRISDNQLVLIFTVSLPAGAGPRHLTFNKNGDRLYLGNELNNEVTVFEFNQQQGYLTFIQRISSLPDSNEHDPSIHVGNIKSYIAEVTLSKDGGYLYVSNRGHDSIAVFKVEQINGELEVISFTKTGGLFPRHFALSPDQNWLLVVHQNSDYLHVFKRNSSTGLLTQTTKKLAVKHAVCICFYQ